ncbi:hypothetical protein RF11_04440 [Thelohanellus kitauei]|uniref:Beta-soluble NSF attachment protein n=1 Tax=Thelohanellus kitauei TaxID=669202 RepID=A0A0C2MUE6_THEKT|nr:hypothetical protein RF11_04440 [Thelohanellus kitauei]
MDMHSGIKTEEKKIVTEAYLLKISDDCNSLINTANEHKRSSQFEKAGDAFVKAAELMHSHRYRNSTVIAAYEDAATCYLQIKDCRALACYLSAVDIFVKTEKIEEGIENCFIWGYKCGQELVDKNKGEELYKKGEDLRHEHGLPHSCVITHFDETQLEIEDDSKREQYLNELTELSMKLFADFALKRMKNFTVKFFIYVIYKIKCLKELQKNMKK